MDEETRSDWLNNGLKVIQKLVPVVLRVLHTTHGAIFKQPSINWCEWTEKFIQQWAEYMESSGSQSVVPGLAASPGATPNFWIRNYEHGALQPVLIRFQGDSNIQTSLRIIAMKWLKEMSAKQSGFIHCVHNHLLDL